ncbi:hypothetical protein Tco_1323223 [Tanacetum coccineum]
MITRGPLPDKGPTPATNESNRGVRPHGKANGLLSIVQKIITSLALVQDQISKSFGVPARQRTSIPETNLVLTVDILKTAAVDKLPTDMEGMEATMERKAILHQIRTLGGLYLILYPPFQRYRRLLFDKLVNDSLQDHLLLLYLSSITRVKNTSQLSREVEHCCSDLVTKYFSRVGSISVEEGFAQIVVT